MLLKNQTPNEGVKSRLEEDYYQQSEQICGSSIFRRLSISNIRKGGENSSVLATIDPNYFNATSEVDKIYQSPFCEFIGLYADNNALLAHTTLTVPIFDDERVASVSEILIKDKEELRGTEDCNINITINIYRQFISFIEGYLLERGGVSQVDYITLGKDGDFWEALREYGYDIQNSGDLENNLIRFSKDLRERDVVRGRNNPNQQN